MPSNFISSFHYVWANNSIFLNSQTVLNDLMHRVAHDRKFLTETLAQTIQVDDFTGRLFKIFEKVWDEGLAQVLRRVWQNGINLKPFKGCELLPVSL